MNDLVVVSVIYGWYQHYMPLYAFSVLHSNPEAYIRFVVLDNTLLPEVMLQMEELRAAGYDRFTVIQKRRLQIPNFPYDAYERFLLDESFFVGYRYAWVGDIDFLIWRESPGLCEREAEIARLDGFCYSNVVRDGLLHDCMVGWHFFEVKPYFALMSKVISDYKASPYSCEGLGTADERLLYHLVKTGIGVREGSDRLVTARDGHGIHLGTYRIGEHQPLWVRSEPWRSLIQEQIYHPVFRSICRRIQHPEMVRILKMLYEDYGRALKLL